MHPSAWLVDGPGRWSLLRRADALRPRCPTRGSATTSAIVGPPSHVPGKQPQMNTRGGHLDGQGHEELHPSRTPARPSEIITTTIASFLLERRAHRNSRLCRRATPPRRAYSSVGLALAASRPGCAPSAWMEAVPAASDRLLHPGARAATRATNEPRRLLQPDGPGTVPTSFRRPESAIFSRRDGAAGSLVLHGAASARGRLWARPPCSPSRRSDADRRRRRWFR